MPPPDERAGLCVYLVSCLLLIAILVGGAFLVLYVTLPESDGTSWLPIAGMLLVGTPWLFWIMTFLYRAVSIGIAARGGGTDQAAPGRTAAAGPTVDEDDAAADSPKGAPRVQSATPTVVDGSQAAPGGGADGSPERTDGAPVEAADDLNGDCSSQASHESELPLFAEET